MPGLIRAEPKPVPVPTVKSTIRSHRPRLNFSPVVLALFALHAQAQSNPPADTVVVTGSVVQRAADEAPFAISVVGRDSLRSAGPMINLSEALAQVPGLVVNNRSNYAQDLQISSRGFGARAGFGVRGIRLYTDGIPASGPDGQGQVSAFDLAGAQRIEVLRGPNSVLYGNSSGGVIALFSAPVKQPEAEADLDVGSFGLKQVRATVGAPLGHGLEMRMGVSSMQVTGFRPQSAAERTTGNLRLGWRGERDTVTLLVNDLDQPAQDALGLTRAQFNTNPLQTAQVALDFNTRKNTHQTQAGAHWRHSFDDGGVLRESTLAAYGGRRDVTQWQAIPVATQANPKHGGGVVDFTRDYSGAEGRLRLGWTDVDMVLGAAIDSQRDARRGYENFLGTTAKPTQLGVTGKLRRNEQDTAYSSDLFAQAEWRIAPSVSANAGVRGGKVELAARDAYITAGNVDDSGSLRYSYTNPVLGLRWQLDRTLQLQVSAARGFESPTLGELAYRPDLAGGLNTALKPQTSQQLEVGAKWRAGNWQADATLFQAQVDNEIAVLSNSAGRSTYQNVGKTLRQGLELSGAWRPSEAWRVAAAMTWLDASYKDTFNTCLGTPCVLGPVAVGNRIAGTQRSNAWAEVAWRDVHWGEFGLEARGAARTAVNDLNTDFAAGYGLAALRWTKAYTLPGGAKFEWLLRVDNVFDRHYAGSVIVNDGNLRFFEPGAPRSALVGMRLIGVL